MTVINYIWTGRISFTAVLVSLAAFERATAIQLASSEKRAFKRPSIQSLLRETTTCTPYELPDELLPPHGEDHKKGLRKTMDRVDASKLSPADFYQDYVQRSKPVILKGGAVNLFDDADTAWTVKGFLQNKHASTKQPCTSVGYFGSWRTVQDSEQECTPKEVFDSPTRMVLLQHFQFESLMCSSESPVNCDPLLWSFSGKKYLSKNQGKLYKEYFKTLRDSNFLVSENASYNWPSDIYWLLSNQAGSSPHHHGPTVNGIFHGAKRWILVDPADMNEKQGYLEIERLQTAMNLSYTSHDWFREVVPSLTVPHYDFILEAGDALFFPDGFTHATIDLCRETVATAMMGKIVRQDVPSLWEVETSLEPFLQAAAAAAA